MKVSEIVNELHRAFPGKDYQEKFIIMDINLARAVYASENYTLSYTEGIQLLENIKLKNRQELDFGINYSIDLPGQILTGKNNESLVSYIGTTDWRRKFRKEDFLTIPYLRYSPYTGRRYSCYYFTTMTELNVVFFNEPEVEEISIKAAFSNPLSVQSFNKDIDDYPMSDSILNGQIIPGLIKKLKSYGW